MITPMDTSYADLRTNIRMTYDEEHLYLLVENFRPEVGSENVVESLRRDFNFSRLTFAEEGAPLIVNGRDQNRGQDVVNQIRSNNGMVDLLAGDVGEESTNQKLIQKAIDNFGKLNGVVTNAGILGLGKITGFDSEKWHKTFQTNLDSVFYLLKYAIPEMQKNGKGVAFAISSIAAYKSFPNHAAYCVSKAGLLAEVTPFSQVNPMPDWLGSSPSVGEVGILPGKRLKMARMPSLIA